MFRLLFWVFVLLLALSFFGISVEAIINSPAGRQNFGYLAYLIVSGWQWFVNQVTEFVTSVQQI